MPTTLALDPYYVKVIIAIVPDQYQKLMQPLGIWPGKEAFLNYYGDHGFDDDNHPYRKELISKAIASADTAVKQAIDNL